MTDDLEFARELCEREGLKPDGNHITLILAAVRIQREKDAKIAFNLEDSDQIISDRIHSSRLTAEDAKGFGQLGR